MRAFHVEGGDRMDRALALASKETGPGLAVATRRASLLDCGTALTDGAGFDTLLPANQASILSGCAELARDVAAANPTQSYAYFTAAAVAARNGDWPVASEQLQLSYLTAPAEQWLAEWRVNLVEDHRDNLDPAILSLHERDLRVMAASWAGLDLLSRRYKADPDFRERITTIVETMPAFDQRRFINYIRSGNG